ncbi:MAG: hypothetical protein WD333_11945 [Dehalococcoidia bacterium]
MAATAGDAASLSDNQQVTTLIRGLASAGASGGLISFSSLAIGDAYADRDAADRAQATENASQPDFLEQFVAVASGSGATGGERFTAIVLLHDDAATAVTNVERLVSRVQARLKEDGQPWADTIDRIETGTSGPVLVARLYHSAFGLDMLAQHPTISPLLTIHE